MTSASFAIGIDLGTANTRIAIYRHDQFEVIPHEDQPLMPSYVAFTRTGRLIGQAAKNQASVNPNNTIFDALRFVGFPFQDSYIQNMIKLAPFTVTHDGANAESKRKPVFEVMYKDVLTTFTPVEILAMIVKRAKKDAEKYLNHQVVNAFITIPAHFNMSQRFAIKDALEIAGINTLGFSHAPTVSLADLTITQKMAGERNVLICDIGASYYDVVLATLEEGIQEVKAVWGDINGVGYDYDTRLMIEMINCFSRATKREFGEEGKVDRTDVTNDSRALRRLRTACKKAKHQLSSADIAIVEIEQLHDGKDLKESITRIRFEEIIQDLIRSLLESVEHVLRDSKFDRSQVHDIIIIGGSSRIPKIQKVISDFFNGKTPVRCLNPEETSARGAAIHASIMSGDTTSKTTSEFLLLDVASKSLGIETAGGVMTPLIKRGTTVPTKKSEVFSTFQDNQQSFSVTCYEGERARTKDNMELGHTQISISSAPRGVPALEVTFDIDRQFNVHASILDTVTRKKSSVRLDGYNAPGFDRISRNKLQRLILAEEMMEAEDVQEETRIEARNTTEELAYSIKDWIKWLSPEQRCKSTKSLETQADAFLQWLDENHFATAEEYEARTQQLQTLRIKVEREQVAHESSYSQKKPERSERTEEEGSERVEEIERYEVVDSAPNSNVKIDIAKPDPQPDGKGRQLEATHLHSSPDQFAGEQAQIEAGFDEVPRPIDQSVERVLEDLGPARLDTPRTTARGMASLFDKSTEGSLTYTDTALSQISTYLKNTGQPDWSKIPRLYTVLRLIDQLDMLDVFIQQGITDIWFPFAQTTLPRAMSPSARANFLKHQEAVLSKSLLFEKSPGKRHARFLQGEPLPYEVVGKLGSGAHGQVDKVMSTVSHREYARKLFRRVRGMSKDAINSFLIELQVLKRVQHYHCIELVRLSQIILTLHILIECRCKAIRTRSISP
jgi:heat shock protein 1/8